MAPGARPSPARQEVESPGSPGRFDQSGSSGETPASRSAKPTIVPTAPPCRNRNGRVRSRSVQLEQLASCWTQPSAPARRRSRSHGEASRQLDTSRTLHAQLSGARQAGTRHQPGPVPGRPPKADSLASHACRDQALRSQAAELHHAFPRRQSTRQKFHCCAPPTEWTERTVPGHQADLARRLRLAIATQCGWHIGASRACRISSASSYVVLDWRVRGHNKSPPVRGPRFWPVRGPRSPDAQRGWSAVVGVGQVDGHGELLEAMGLDEFLLGRCPGGERE